MSRHNSNVVRRQTRPEMRKKCTVFEGDTFNIQILNEATKNIDTAYYLIHSMGDDGDFVQKEKTSARNFLNACIANGVKKIVYLECI